ncbi:ABC transporter permease [Gloeobacter kilaueensis]|uniref:Oligopeptide transport system permease protein OppC n=1 Tax=Gloeobacter kilaueensis (strain ATCC BAA-2537 / CCAP 1431/1 / ULC 316 / JS1) TaxID=1183438 RepID=U5QIF0_GLOK1|nr:ABC transporter permease subunit [Gloeobacter kilaueensis]AGY57369.1 binding-protein-dependent transport systems inner membrane component [Gloeobacter kilaueensis JS1]
MQTSSSPVETPFEPVKGSSLWQDAWRRLLRNKLAVASGIVFSIILIAVLLGPKIIALTWGYTYELTDAAAVYQPPGPAHWFGTDQLGRDLLVRSLVGGQISLLVAVVASVVSLVIGVTYGAVAGYLGGRVDEAMMRFVDILYSLPDIFLIIVLLAFFSKDLFVLFGMLGAISWLTMARIVRGQVLSIKNREFVEAARAIGVGTGQIIFRHIVPNTLGPVIVYTTLTIPSVMLTEAFLSFLGLGVQPPLSSWGTLVQEGVGAISVYPWHLLFPGLLMTATLFSLNFLGDGLRDALDPQSRAD